MEGAKCYSCVLVHCILRNIRYHAVSIRLNVGEIEWPERYLGRTCIFPRSENDDDAIFR
jgi:hypothetical protein